MRDDINWRIAPDEIVYISLCSIYKMPISSKFYEDARNKYPEYFPEEVEYQDKLSLVPKEIQDKCTQEQVNNRMAFDELMKTSTGGDGFMSWIFNPKEKHEYIKAWELEYSSFEKRQKDIWNKYYEPYGLEKE